MFFVRGEFVEMYGNAGTPSAFRKKYPDRKHEQRVRKVMLTEYHPKDLASLERGGDGFDIDSNRHCSWKKS
jgi:hypothetical protein